MAITRSGTVFTVNTTVAGTQRYGDVAALSAGFVSVWADGNNAIRAQRLTAAGVKTGAEVLVNTPDDAIIQGKPAVAGLEDGGFVVVWYNYLSGIVAQRFDAGGAKVGDDLLITSGTRFYQDRPSVTAVEGGGFAVSWEGKTTQSGTPSIYSQLVDETGGKVGGQVLVTPAASGFGAFASVTAKLGGGAYVVAWQDSGATSAIKAQRFDETGAKAGGVFTVATASSFVASPSLVALKEGGFVAVWSGSDGSGYGVTAQVFSETGKAVGSRTTVQATGTDFVANPDVAALPDGGFIVSWQKRNSTTDDTDVFARTFAADGKATGTAFVLSATSGGEQTYARLGVDPDGATGKLVALWTDQTGAAIDIKGQTFTVPVPLKPPALPEGRLAVTGDASTAVLVDVGRPVILKDTAALKGGGFVTVWMENTSSGGRTFQAQRFDDRGKAVGAQTTLAKGEKNDFNYLEVKGLPGGGFSVAWTKQAAAAKSTIDSVIHHRAFDANGKAVGKTTVLGATKHEEREVKDIAVLKDGTYAVMWEAEVDSGDAQIHLQRFKANGEALGAQTLVSPAGMKQINGSVLTALDNGTFVLTWQTGFSIFDHKQQQFAQVISGAGVATGPRIALSSPHTDWDSWTNVTALDGGGFAVVRSSGPKGGPFALKVQAYTNTGAKAGAEVVWPSETGLLSASIVSTPKGFLVVWEKQDITTHYARAFDKNGALLGGTFVLSQSHDYPYEGFFRPEYIRLQDGSYVSVWASLAATSTFTTTGEAEVIDGGPFDYPSDAVLGAHFLTLQTPITGDATANTLTGTAGADRIRGLGGPDILKGGAGDDVLIGGKATDRFEGGAGTDTVSYAEATAKIGLHLSRSFLNTGEAAGDTFTLVERFVGTRFGDRMEGDAAANVLDGWFGDDALAGLAGADTLIGGRGNDVLEGGAGADLLDGGIGLDTASYSRATAAVIASLRAPSLNTGEAAGDVYRKVESLAGSAFADVLRGDGERNRLDGNAGDDVLAGDHGDDFLFGGAGDDVLDGGNGADRMEGGEGNDTFIGGPGADRMNGGGGIDTVTFADSGPSAGRAGVKASLMTSSLDFLGGSAPNEGTGDARGDSFRDVENLIGSGYDDDLTGTGAKNLLRGLAGNDVLTSVGGGDTLQGGAGDDTYRIAGADIVDEGVRGSGGTDTVESYGTFNLANTSRVLGRVENLTLKGKASIDGTGNDRENVLTGNEAGNRLDGGEDADTMRGGAGGDTYVVDDAGDIVDEAPAGSSGNDTVSASVSFSLADTRHVRGVVENLALTGKADLSATGDGRANDITGNTGANVITGGGGADDLDGGKDTAADRFVFKSVSESGPTSATRDEIANFGATDLIDLSAIDANGPARGLQEFVFDTDRVFSTGEIRQTVKGKHVLLEMNTDADSAAEMAILVLNSGLLGRGDFVL